MTYRNLGVSAGLLTYAEWSVIKPLKHPENYRVCLMMRLSRDNNKFYCGGKKYFKYKRGMLIVNMGMLGPLSRIGRSGCHCDQHERMANSKTYFCCLRREVQKLVDKLDEVLICAGNWNHFVSVAGEISLLNIPAISTRLLIKEPFSIFTLEKWSTERHCVQ